MMIPEVGSMPKVSGRSIATPEGGPTPGSAPIRIPTITPAIAIMMLNGVSATPKPIERLARKSTFALEGPEHPFRHRHAQPVHEHQPVEARRRGGDRDRHPPRMAAEIAHQNHEVQRSADDHAGDSEQRDERHGDAEHDQHVAQALAAWQPGLAWILCFQTSDEEAKGEQTHDQAEPERQEGGARTARAPP